jgi:hypothetical protein
MLLWKIAEFMEKEMKSPVISKILTISGSIILGVLLVLSVPHSYGGEKEELRKFNSEGRIEVEVVFLNPLLKESGNILQFEIRISTQTENLEKFDPDMHAYLQINGGMLHRNIAWIDQKRDSHHINGILKFVGPVPTSSKKIQLFLHDLGNVNKRKFKWLLPISRKQPLNP